VQAFVEHEQAVAPADVHLPLTDEVSSVVRDRLQLLVKNGVIAFFTTTICLFGPLAFLEGNMG
jgi:hypothetical protein